MEDKIYKLILRPKGIITRCEFLQIFKSISEVLSQRAEMKSFINAYINITSLVLRLLECSSNIPNNTQKQQRHLVASSSTFPVDLEAEHNY